MPRDRFYNSAIWKKLRAAKLRRDPLCEMCLPLRITAARTVDHIRSIKSGGSATDWENLQSLCLSCHSTKTNYIEIQGKDRVRIKGVDPKTGLPADPGHWWNQKQGGA
jgi:5-methylcytosine-specific restriction enzyme A